MITRFKVWLTAMLLFALIPLVDAESLRLQTLQRNLVIFDAILVVIAVSLVVWLALRTRNSLPKFTSDKHQDFKDQEFNLLDLDEQEITALLDKRKVKRKAPKSSTWIQAITIVSGALLSSPVFAAPAALSTPPLIEQPGILITATLILIPLFVAVVLLVIKVNRIFYRYQQKKKLKEAGQLIDYLVGLDDDTFDSTLARRKASLQYALSNKELSGSNAVEDPRGLIQHVQNTSIINFVATKQKAQKRPGVDRQLTHLVLSYLGCSIAWLVIGTTVGEYLGIKFVAPDVDHVSWLSFGRLRPVHTNAVFWGWSSLAMIGLAYYIIPTISNVPIHNLRKGWISLFLINASVFIGSLCLMAGINNGGGEYREYIWPVMALFALGLVVTLINFIQTIARRTTHEIYISGWYIVSAIIFTLVITTIAYWPAWQNGLGETIIQGYYMHQGVGMWFMLFNLGIVYYLLPQQLNKPIYSYSLGILAFWTQILFYTLIGTHHFVFSAIPWWLQTVAIVGSVGMLIPVTAGTINFFMTFKGGWNKIANSYTLPFYVVGIVFYFTGSLQGTAEAFRFTNQLWHFTDFTVAHSHITMYGIIAFLLWAGCYAIIPRLTGNEPSQPLVGAHFWLAFIGLLFYTIPLMIGGTLRGLIWMEGKSFMESVVAMAPYWIWRAIGGSLMWISHIVFAYNFYRMVVGNKEADLKTAALIKIKLHSMAAKNEV